MSIPAAQELRIERGQNWCQFSGHKHGLYEITASRDQPMPCLIINGVPICLDCIKELIK